MKIIARYIGSCRSLPKELILPETARWQQISNKYLSFKWTFEPTTVRNEKEKFYRGFCSAWWFQSIKLNAERMCGNISRKSFDLHYYHMLLLISIQIPLKLTFGLMLNRISGKVLHNSHLVILPQVCSFLESNS